MATQETATHAVLASSEPELDVHEVSKRFAGVQALRGVSCWVGRQEIAGLIGPNGAGKTTLFNCLTGFLRIDAGTISYKGSRIDGRKPEAIAALGAVRTFQNIRMFRDLTPFESLVIAQHTRYKSHPVATLLASPRQRDRMAVVFERAGEILRQLGLENVRQKRCKDLTLLQQRKLELGRALAADPQLFLLDEVSAGATAAEARELVEVILKIRDEGRSVLVIEHNIPFVMAVADRITVLNFGEVVAEGAPADIRANQLVKDIYLGT